MATVSKVEKPVFDSPETAIDVLRFQKRLGDWYRENARKLPWRGVHDAYATWVSEVMLQQTRVATVIERYQEFMQRFPTVQALAAASEHDVLAIWSGLGYYRRARMLHKGAQHVVKEFAGRIPDSSQELLNLPGVGEYTAAAISSISFGESVAVLDGNVERVLLRLLGKSEEKSSGSRKRLMLIAQNLVPVRHTGSSNAAGDHNQAMMELGATVCLPRGPLCLNCPVVELCKTRGEHTTLARVTMKRVRVAHLLEVRTRGGAREVLLERRPSSASLMPDMLELPPLPTNAIGAFEPVMRVKHAITNTNYDVEIFTATTLRKEIPTAKSMLSWLSVGQLGEVPLTGLTRKVLQRAGLFKKSTSRKLSPCQLL